MPLRSVYHHPKVSEQHISIHIVITKSLDGWSTHFIAVMEIIEITKILFVTHFGLKSKA